MALTFTITDGTTTLNLLTSGIQSRDGYMPQVATPPGDGSIPPYLTETIPVLLQGATHNALAVTLQTFHALQWNASRYWQDPTYVTPVWFQCQTAGETNARRALVKSLSLDLGSGLGGIYDQSCNITKGGVAGTIILERHPYWEATSERDLPEYNPAAGIVTVYDYTAAGDSVGAHDIVGDIGARINVQELQVAAGDTIGRIWMGIRSAAKHPALANFVTVWECENGTNNALESGIVDRVDATASGGDAVRLTETDLDWDDGTFREVLEIEMSDVSANESDQFGTFQWLLRAQVSAGTWEVQLRYGYAGMDDGDFIKGNTVELTNTSWDMVESDIAIVPIRDLKALSLTDIVDTFEATYAIQIWARRTSGAGTLDLDCLLPIPMDEGYLFMSEFSATADKIYIGTSPHDEWFGITNTAAGVGETIAMDSDNCTLPPGDGRLITAWAGPTASDITDDFLIFSASDFGNYYERWLSLRGAE